MHVLHFVLLILVTSQTVICVKLSSAVTEQRDWYRAVLTRCLTSCNSASSGNVCSKLTEKALCNNLNLRCVMGAVEVASN